MPAALRIHYHPQSLDELPDRGMKILKVCLLLVDLAASNINTQLTQGKD